MINFGLINFFYFLETKQFLIKNDIHFRISEFFILLYMVEPKKKIIWLMNLKGRMNGHIPQDVYPNCSFCERLRFFSHPINNNSIPNMEPHPLFDSAEPIRITRNFNSNSRIVTELDPATQILKETIEQLTIKYNKTPEEIINICEKVSGKIRDVEEYLQADEQKREFLIWTTDEDEVLETVKSEDNRIFKLLLRYKGKEKIKNRLSFKNIILPFEF